VNARSDRETNPMRIVVADRRPEVRSALRLLVEQDGETLVSAEAARVDELLAQVRIACPDAVLLDCDLPDLLLNQFLPQLRSVCPGVRVVSLCSRPEMRQAALSAGADAFVSKTESPETLLATLRQCLQTVRSKGNRSLCQEDHSHQIRKGKEPRDGQTA
jgi:DNA-binding NarL/FixJ family response regulator